eukprot:13451176-Alexandrium_andersonii.AAC.1
MCIRDSFCYVVDRFYSPEWLGYVDDLTARAGRVLGGVWYTDAEYELRIEDASSLARVVEAQSTSEALENQGFNPKGIGSEAQKGSRAQRAAPSASSARAAAIACFPSGRGRWREAAGSA